MTFPKSFKRAYVYIWVAALAISVISGCTDEREQSMSFHDEYLEQQVVQKMESMGIPFRREGSTIWYSISSRKVVKKIFEEELSSRPIQYKFYDKEKQNQFLSLLGDQGIVAISESNIEPPYVVNVPKENRDVSEEIFRKVLRGN